MLIISDLHVGVNRTGGTTPQSQAALRDYLRNWLEEMLHKESDGVTINGDLFDGFTVDTNEVVKVARIFIDWLGGCSNGSLNLIAGNHDYNPRGDKLSSFHLLCHILAMSDVARDVRVFDQGFTQIERNLWCIPHMPNQELFNLEITNAIEGNGRGNYLLLHCNYKNGFAENSDHSLNIDDEQVGALMRAGWTLILGHEHVGYTLREGRVIVVGNQIPSSVSDCLGEKEKFALHLDCGKVKKVSTWRPDGSFIEADWRELPDLTGYQFIRVTGDASAMEAADVIKTIAKLRQTSDAFVISSAVKIEGHAMSEDMTKESIESIRAFDVVGAILGELTEPEQAVVKGLLNAT